MVLTRTTSIVEEASISIIEKQLHQERITWTNNNLSINPYDEDWSIKEGKGSLKSISWLRVHGFQCFFLMQVVGWQKLITMSPHWDWGRIDAKLNYQRRWWSYIQSIGGYIFNLNSPIKERDESANLYWCLWLRLLLCFLKKY